MLLAWMVFTARTAPRVPVLAVFPPKYAPVYIQTCKSCSYFLTAGELLGILSKKENR